MGRRFQGEAVVGEEARRFVGGGVDLERVEGLGVCVSSKSRSDAQRAAFRRGHAHGAAGVEGSERRCRPEKHNPTATLPRQHQCPPPTGSSTAEHHTPNSRGRRRRGPGAATFFTARAAMRGCVLFWAHAAGRHRLPLPHPDPAHAAGLERLRRARKRGSRKRAERRQRGTLNKKTGRRVLLGAIAHGSPPLPHTSASCADAEQWARDAAAPMAVESVRVSGEKGAHKVEKTGRE